MKKHSLAWWLCIGWWWYIYKFMLYYLPLCLIRLFYGKQLDRIVWSKWKKEIHDTDWQSVRLARANSQDMVIEKRNPLGVATILGSSGNRYKVTLRQCSCPDFQRRKLPCKHMYLLAESAGILDQEDTE